MLDNALINLFATRLEAAALAGGWLSGGLPYAVVQKNPPTQEGVPTAPTIFFEKLFDDVYGWPALDYEHNVAVPPATQGTFTDTENQWCETTFQVSALVIQDPNDLTIPTASDVVNYVNRFLHTRASIEYFKGSSVSMLRVTKVRNPYFEDDRNTYEANPSFDITLCHQNSIQDTVPATNIVTGKAVPGYTNNGIYPVPE
jgi:hypothetical protein